jgi:hypothetical protein
MIQDKSDEYHQNYHSSGKHGPNTLLSIQHTPRCQAAATQTTEQGGVARCQTMPTRQNNQQQVYNTMGAVL